MNTVISMLLVIVNNSYKKDINYSIAYTVLENIDSPENLNLNYIAEQSRTSVSSVNKFCQMLGFKKFSDFKFQLTSRIEARKQQMKNRLGQMNEEEILSKIAMYAQTDFDREGYKKQVNHMVDLIYTSKTTVILGACFPTALAAHLQEDMFVFNKPIYIQPQKSFFEMGEYDDNTLILLVSLTGRMYDYAKASFQKSVRDHQHHLSMISGIRQYPEEVYLNSFVELPIDSDQETGNVLLLETFRYIKYLYWYKYVREE